MAADQINTVILGASGYTGAELLRLVMPHPNFNVTAITGDSNAGKTIGGVYPHLASLDMTLVKQSDVNYDGVDLVFCCLPHGTTQEIIAGLPSHVRIVDLSADFRLESLDDYASWYGHPHLAPELQKEAVYGLTELYRDAVKTARLVANPGCYPTCALLPLLPLANAGLIDANSVTIDAMSGVTGAGRKVAQPFLFCEANESAKAYGVGGHRHASEMEQEIGKAADQKVCVSFTPHLVPMSRGMSATIHVKLADGKKADDLHAHLKHAYADEPFVLVCPDGIIPSTSDVRGINQCRIAVKADRREGHAIIVSVIDNLMKGASGQAIQNANLMFDLDESIGLTATAVFP